MEASTHAQSNQGQTQTKIIAWNDDCRAAAAAFLATF